MVHCYHDSFTVRWTYIKRAWVNLANATYLYENQVWMDMNSTPLDAYSQANFIKSRSDSWMSAYVDEINLEMWKK